MSDYKVPVQEFLFILKHIIGYEQHIQVMDKPDADFDMVETLLPEAARFFEQELAPTNHTADMQGTELDKGIVKTAAVFDGIYQKLVESGWIALSGDPEYGGAGFPEIVDLTVKEMLQSSNLSFSLLPMLTQGVVHALSIYSADEQKNIYLEKLVTGEWAGTMNLTEPQAGTDLGSIKTKAQLNGDHYLIKGQKIFITWGDHECCDNIVQLVLARVTDAPAGTKGISMFIVPKYLINEDGSLGERNDSKAVGIEHKLGIHASPTCTMQFGDKGGAVGYLVGEENKGLIYMFAMMNAARLGVGQQGVSLGERAYQHAVAYAQDRVQGKVTGKEAGATIIGHPDVRRMLMQMRSLNEAGRALSFEAIAEVDRSHHHQDEAARAASAARVEVLTPLVKAWCTEASIEVSYLGVQVHGGMGYIEETGVAQFSRDARILPIYEGTNGIQALDFIGRKTLRDGAKGVTSLVSDFEKTIAELADTSDEVATLRDQFSVAVEQCKDGLKYVMKNPLEAEAIAFNYMMLFGNTACAWLMLRSAKAASGLLQDNASDRFALTKINTVTFFMNQILPRNSMYLATLKTGSTDIMALEDNDFLVS